MVGILYNKTMKKFIIALVVVIIAVTIWYVVSIQKQNIGTLINTAVYSCDGGKTITASFYKGAPAPAPEEGQPPKSNDSIVLTFADSSSLRLMQAISASGARYANDDESFVFWDKGGKAMVLQNGAEKDYKNCAVKIGS